MKVLIIEDNLTDLKLMRVVLEGGGHESCERQSTEGALEVIRRYRPDVIMLDLNLPDGGSLALARTLHQALDTQKIPVVAVTAYPLRYRLPDVLAAGCVGCIIKPIDTRELLNQIGAITSIGVRDGPP